MHRYDLIKYKVDVNARPWVIVGSGPSIINLTDFQRYNIWSINHSIEYIKSCQVLSIFDHEAFLEIDYRKYQYDILITRTISLSHVDLSADNVCFVEYDCDVFRMNNVRFFENEVQAMQNSASAAVLMLGQFGVKQIFMAGIDGGVGRHEMFAGAPSAAVHNNTEVYDRHFAGMRHWADHFEIELIKL